MCLVTHYHPACFPAQSWDVEMAGNKLFGLKDHVIPRGYCLTMQGYLTALKNKQYTRGS